MSPRTCVPYPTRLSIDRAKCALAHSEAQRRVREGGGGARLAGRGSLLLYSSRRKPSHQTMSGRDTDFRTHCSVTRRRDARSILMERERSESSCFMVLAGRHTHTSTGVDTCAADAGATPNAPAVAATRIGGTWLACVDSIYLSIYLSCLERYTACYAGKINTGASDS